MKTKKDSRNLLLIKFFKKCFVLLYHKLSAIIKAHTNFEMNKKMSSIYRMLTLTSSFSIAYVVLGVDCSNGLVELADLDDGIPLKNKF